MMRMSKARSGFLIAALVLMWGLSWPIYKVALNYTPPILFAGMRTLLGGLLLFAVLLPGYRKMKFRENWRIYCISAILNAFLFYGIQTVGLRFLPEGLFTILTYLQPVLVGIFAWLWLGEAMTPLKLVGFFIGFGGVGLISITGVTGHVSVVGLVLAIATAVTWALGTVYVKGVGNKVDAMWLVAIQCVIGGAGLMVAGLGVEHWSDIVWNGTYSLGLIYGSIFGIPTAWVIFFTLVRNGDAGKVASFTFLVPLIAITLGSVFLHEPLTVYLFIGLALIVMSIYMVNVNPRRSLK